MSESQNMRKYMNLSEGKINEDIEDLPGDILKKALRNAFIQIAESGALELDVNDADSFANDDTVDEILANYLEPLSEGRVSESEENDGHESVKDYNKWRDFLKKFAKELTGYRMGKTEFSVMIYSEDMPSPKAMKRAIEKYSDLLPNDAKPIDIKFEDDIGQDSGVYTIDSSGKIKEYH